MNRLARTLATLVATTIVATTLLPGIAAAETRVVVDDRRDSAQIVFTEEDDLRIVADPAERGTDILRQTTSYGARFLTVTVRLRDLDLHRRGRTVLFGQIATGDGRQGFEVTLRPGREQFRWDGASADPSEAPCAGRLVAVDVLPKRRSIRVTIPTPACLGDAPWVRTSTLVGHLVGLRADDPEDFRYWLDGALTRGPVKARQPFGGMGPKVHRG